MVVCTIFERVDNRFALLGNALQLMTP